MGINGVPSYRIFRRKLGRTEGPGKGEEEWNLVSEIIWGQDESVIVEDYISGWDGESRVSEPDAEKVLGKGSAKL